MFGDERGGDTNVRLGFKDKKNLEAQTLYYQELERLVRDLNLRYLRTRFPKMTQEKVEDLYGRLSRERGTVEGVAWTDLLHLPHTQFFRRRGEPAYRMVGLEGRSFTDVEEYIRYLAANLSEAYRASRDMKVYGETLRAVVAGTLSAEEAGKKAPKLERADTVCPCSKSVRWVEREAATNGNGHPGNGNPASA